MGKSKSMHRMEKDILKRDKQLKYPTDRFGPTSLMTQVNHINSSRLIMMASQMGHMVSIKNPELPLVPTGFEHKLASYSGMINRTEDDYEIVAKFQKNDYIYVLIGYDKKHKRYHAWKRVEAEEHSEGFATRFNNTFIDSLEIGDTIDRGTVIQKSTNFDRYMNYQYGKNVNVVYMVSTHVYEDGILAMNGVDKMFNTYRSEEKRIKLADNELLINWYGDDDHYQPLPKIGEKTRNGFVGAVRRADSSSAPRSLKTRKLQHIERSDRVCVGEGRVIDIEILTNKDPRKFSQAGANAQINALYEEQQEYYRTLYRYMDKIVQMAEDGECTYTDEFSIICAEAHDYVDASAFFADSNDNIYGAMEIVVHLLNEEEMMVGSKFVGRSGNKGVIAKIIPKERSWHMEDGTPIHFVVAALGVIGRLNYAQLYEHSANELGATVVRMMRATDDLEEKFKIAHKLLTYLNPDEAKDFKKWWKNLESKKEKEKFCRRIERHGITIVQDPVDNANILDFERAYDVFEPNYQRVVFPDGSRTMHKLLCAKMFYFRLKQDPLEKYSVRSHGPVNPLTTLPSKSNLKKKAMIPFSDVPVRFGEMELEVLLCMCPHPWAIADFMTENSTSYEVKYQQSEKTYLEGIYDYEQCMLQVDDPDEDEDEIDYSVMNPTLNLSGKKNVEQIEGLLNVLGTGIQIEYETAPKGEYFEG